MSQPVILLGARGFLGRHAHAALAREGHAVSVLQRPTPAELAAAVAGSEQPVVVDCSWAGVHSSTRDDDAAQQANVDRVAGLLAAAAPHAPRWVGLGSQAEYAKLAGGLAEDAPIGPDTAYGRAKVAVHRMLLDTLGPAAVSWLRIFSCYGPGQPAGWLVPDTIALLRAGQPVSLRNPDLACDYLYAGDAGEAVAAVVGTRTPGVFNLGSGRPTRLLDLVEAMRTLCAPGGTIIRAEPGSGAAPCWWAEIATLSARAGWAPRTDLLAGLGATLGSVV